jgi:hypothetical protein
VVNGLGKKTELVILERASGSMLVPAMVAAAGERAAFRFIYFFNANIRNPKHPRGLCRRGARLLRLARSAQNPRARRDPHPSRLGLYRDPDAHL